MKGGLQIYALFAVFLLASLVALSIHLEVNDNQITALDVSILCAAMSGVIFALAALMRILR